VNDKKKVAVIGTVGLPASYGGFETLVNYLTKEKSSNFEFTVYCEKTAKKDRLKVYNGSQLTYLPFKANGGQSIIYDIVSIITSWFKFDALLILGTPGCIILPLLKIIKNTKTIINFGGMEWKRNKWGQLVRFYLKLTEKIAIKNATYVVADNKYFLEYIKDNYYKESQLIEYGGDHVSKIEITNKLKRKYSFLNLKYDLSVSRAQPDNNLHIILETYSKLPERNLVLISNYAKSNYGRNLIKKYSNFPNIIMQTAIYDLYELDAIRRNAELYIHSHTFCGTAPSLVEAMNLELPVVAFDVPTNHYTTENKAIYFKNEKELSEIVKTLKNSDKKIIGQEMGEIAQRRYTWKRISDSYAELF